LSLDIWPIPTIYNMQCYMVLLYVDNDSCSWKFSAFNAI